MPRRLVAATLLLMASTSLHAQKATRAPRPWVPLVSFSVDAPDDLKRELQTKLKKRLEKFSTLTAFPDAEWGIIVVGMKPEGREGDARRFALSVTFVQNVVHLDPAIIDDISRNNTYVSPQRIEAYRKRSTTNRMFHGSGVFEGRWDELEKTVADIVDGFDKDLIEAVRKARAESAKPAPAPPKPPKP